MSMGIAMRMRTSIQVGALGRAMHRTRSPSAGCGVPADRSSSRQKRDYVPIDHNQLLRDAYAACLPHYQAM